MLVGLQNLVARIVYVIGYYGYFLLYPFLKPLGWVCLAVLYFSAFIWVKHGEGDIWLAQRLYPRDAAPWENVRAVYYPDTQSRPDWNMGQNVESLDECREWVLKQQKHYGKGKTGTFRCQVGELGDDPYKPQPRVTLEETLPKP